MEYLNRLQKFHLVAPATRSTFSYSNHLVSKPTQLKMPLLNRLYSAMDSTASTILRLISRKSRAPSTISVSDILLMIL